MSSVQLSWTVKLQSLAARTSGESIRFNLSFRGHDLPASVSGISPLQLRSLPTCFSAPRPYDLFMRDRDGNDCDLWVMVDHNGERTLFRMVEVGNEVGNGGDVLRLARDLHAPAVVVDMALPELPALDQTSGPRHRSGNSRLILVKLRTPIDDNASGVAVRRPGRDKRLNASSVRGGDLPRARGVHRRPLETTN